MREPYHDFAQHEMAKSQRKLRAAGHAATGAAVGSLAGPVGSVAGGAVGYVHGVVSAAAEQCKNEHRRVTATNLATEAIKTVFRMMRSIN